jgi:hypothetical protein
VKLGRDEPSMPYDKYRWSNGDCYEGEWTSDMKSPQGRGQYTFNSHGTYEGEFRCGKRHGRGVFVSKLEDRYDGEWANGLKCGQVTWIRGGQLKGHEYRGEFRDGHMHGTGSFKWPDGSVFKGQIDQWHPTRGVLVEASGREYAVTYASDCGLFWNS